MVMNSFSFQPVVPAVPPEAPRFAVLGAGHGGLAMAGHLALMGFQVSLFNRSEERLEPIRQSGGITLNGVVEGFAPLSVVTSNMEEALAEADVIMVVVPANAHRWLAEKAAPYLRDGHIVVLHPGRTGGALEFLHVVASKGVRVDATIAEAQTLIYTARNNNPAQVTIYGIKNNVPVAALPSHNTVKVVKTLRTALPQFVSGSNVLKTSLDNIGAIFHPGILILNATRVEATRGDFDFYTDGVTPSISKVLEAMDAERVAVADALGIRAMNARTWLYVAYDAAGRTLYEAIQNNHGYKGIKAPTGLFHRYITEDIPMSLVPIAALGELLEVPTPTIRSMIHLGSMLLGEDYWRQGRTKERMVIDGLSATEIRRFVMEGGLAWLKEREKS